MYELINGSHPIWNKDEDDKTSYRDKLRNELKFLFNSKFTDHAKQLFLWLCKPTPSLRYNCEKVLSHPWITWEEDGKIPLTAIEENLYNYEVKSKIFNVNHSTYNLGIQSHLICFTNKRAFKGRRRTWAIWRI